MSQSVGNPSPYAESPEAGRIMSRIVDQLSGSKPSSTLTAAYALKRNIGSPRSSSSLKAAFSRTHAYANLLPAGKQFSGEPGTAFAPPRSSDAVAVREENKGAGIYGIGIKIDVTPPFKVQRVVDLQDSNGESINDQVTVGDRLVYIDGQAIDKAEYLNFVEKLIFGERNTAVTLTFKRKEDDSSYKVVANRHVPIKTWEVSMKWAELRPELAGQELSAEPSIVETLENIRMSLHDRSGTAIDILKEDVHEPCSLGFRLALETSSSTLRPKQIESITPGGPAFMGGDLMVGDEIVSVGGVAATESNVLKLLQGSNVIGSKCFISIKRQTRSFDVRLIRSSAAQLRQVEMLMSSIASLQKAVGETGNAEAVRLAQQVHAQACQVESGRCQREINLSERVAGLHHQIIDTLNQAEMRLHPASNSEAQLANLMRRIEELNAQLAAANDAKNEGQKRLIDLTQQSSDLEHRLQESQDQLASLRASVGNMVPRAVYDSVQSSLDAVTAEKALLEESAKKHVAAVLLESANEEIQALRSQLAKLREDAGGTVPKEELEHLRDGMGRLQQEREQMRAAMAGMVERGELDKALAELELKKAELHKLRIDLLRKIDKDELAAAHAEVDKKLAELERLRKSLAGMVTEAELNQEREETQKLARMVQELRAQKQRLEEELAESRVRGVELVPAADLVGLQAQLSALKLKLEDAEAAKRALELYNAGQRERIGKLLAELQGAQQQQAQLEERGGGASHGELAAKAAALAAAEERLAECLAQLERLKTERQELRAALERQRVELEGMVPRSELLAARREAAAKREEAAAERAEAAVQAEQRQRAMDSVLAARQELEGLRAAQMDMAPRAELLAAMTEGREQRDKAEGRAREVELLEKERQGLREELERMQQEAAALRLAEVEMVSRAELDAAREAERKAGERADGCEQEAKWSREQLARANEAVLDLRKQVEELRHQLSQRVPRGELLVAEAEARTRAEEAAGLREEVLLLQEQGKGFREQGLALREQVEKLRTEQADKVPRAEVLASVEQQRAAEDRAQELKSELEAARLKIEEQLKALAAATAELEALREQALGSVPRKTHLEVLREAKEGKEAAAEWEARAVSAERIAKEVRDGGRSVTEEAERLRTEVADTVPRGQLVALESHVSMLQQDVTALERRKAELAEQLSSHRGLLHDRNSEIDALKARIEDMVPRADLVQAQADAKAASVKADALEQEVESLLELLEGCKEKLSTMVAREKVEAAEAQCARTSAELQALQRQLAEAGLGQHEVLRRVTEALRGPTPIEPTLVAELLVEARGPPWTNLEELTALVRKMGLQPQVSAGELLLLLGAVQAPPQRSVLDATQLLKVADEDWPLSAGELSRLRRLVVPQGRGADERTLADLEEMLQLVPTLRELRALLEERAVVQVKLREMEAEALQREAEIADLRQRICPRPKEHEEVAALLAENAELRQRLHAALRPAQPLMEPEGRNYQEAVKVKVRAVKKGMRILCTTDETAPSETNYRAGGPSPLLVELRSTETLRAICVDSEGRTSEVTAEHYVCEKSKDGLAGIGLLLERMSDSDQTQVKSVKPGGAADIDGRIAANDYLLKIDGRNVKGLSLSTMVKLTQGRQGTQIALLLSRHPANSVPGEEADADGDIYAVTLTRVLPGEASKMRTSTLAASVAMGLLKGAAAASAAAPATAGAASESAPHAPAIMADGSI